MVRDFISAYDGLADYEKNNISCIFVPNRPFDKLGNDLMFQNVLDLQKHTEKRVYLL